MHIRIKNLSVVIDALERSKTNVKVVFAGKEDFFYKRLRREITRRGVSSRVIFLALPMMKTYIHSIHMRKRFYSHLLWKALACLL